MQPPGCFVRGWGSSASSEAYAITAAAPAEAKSAIKTDRTSYTSGDDMAVTVTLKDASDNAVTGAAASLTADTVTVANATLKSGSWTDNGDGTYTGTYTATTAGTGLKAAVKIGGWGKPAESGAYVINGVPALKDIAVGGYAFASNAGFPTTGFKGAKFTLELSNASATDYDWKADASWVSVSAGVVSFTGTGTKDKVTITGTPKSGGTAITYSFALSSWYINRGGGVIWSDAAAYCTAQSGYSQPTVQQLTGKDGYVDGSRGALGGLWSEWGYAISDAGWEKFGSWTAEVAGSARIYWSVYLASGLASSQYEVSSNGAVCRRGL